jgi:hypothetical protein
MYGCEKILHVLLIYTCDQDRFGLHTREVKVKENNYKCTTLEKNESEKGRKG